MKEIKIKTIIRIALLAGTAISMFFVPWILVWAWILPLPDTIDEQIDEALGHGFDGMIVYVDSPNKSPEYFTGGWHDRSKHIPAYPKALFKIASISKLYTAVAVAKLVSEGRLSLNKTLAEYMPELSSRIEYADKITLKMMVGHRSGIPDYTRTPNFWNSPKYTGDFKFMNLILDKPADFEPDKSYGYSNTNYLLIRKIINNELGYNYKQYIKEEILIPNGLNHTFSSIKEVNMDSLMSGYYVGYEEDTKTNFYGSMVATAEDVGKFVRALNDGSLLTDKEQKIYSSIYVFEHGGLLVGYESYAKYYEDIDAVVVQFVNTTDFDGYTWNLSEIIFNRIGKILTANIHKSSN